MTYRCYNDEYHPAFDMAFQLAVRRIKEFKQSLPEGDGEVPDFRWLVTQPQMLFAHLVFAYRNQVFAIYVSVEEEGVSSFTERHRWRLLSSAEDFDLIPCEFKVVLKPLVRLPNGAYSQALRPAVKGLGLVDVRTGEAIDLLAMTSDVQVEMSEWERHNLAVQMAADALEKEYDGEIVGVSSVMNMVPQVWFQDKDGRMCWCIVREWVGEDEDVLTAADVVDILAENEHLKVYDGYFIGVSIVSMALIVYDAEGNIIPPSQRFTSACPLYRGDPLAMKMTPLERVFVADV